MEAAKVVAMEVVVRAMGVRAAMAEVVVVSPLVRDTLQVLMLTFS